METTGSGREFGKNPEEHRSSLKGIAVTKLYLVNEHYGKTGLQ
jgi:hypothetical protein